MTEENHFSCYAPDCSSINTKIIKSWRGKPVYPEDKYDDGNSGIVVECLDCEEITGYLIVPTGVVDEEE